MSYSYDFNNLIPSKYLEAELDYDAVTEDVEYQDGGKNFAENSDTFPRRWLFEYNSLTNAQAAAIDAVYNTYRKANSFSFTDKNGNVFTDCYFERFNKDHDGHKSWIQKRRFSIVKYDAEIPPELDLTAPSIPTNVAASQVSTTSFNVTWAASTDNVAVAGYKVRVTSVNGTSDYTIADPNTLIKLVTGATAGIEYTVKVLAYDATGNESAYSATATITLGEPSLDLPSTTVAVWEANSLNASLNDGDAVSSWTDSQSSVAATSSGTERPILKKNIQNGHSVLRFDGVDDFLDAGDNFDLGTQGLCALVVFKKTNAGDGTLFAKSVGAAAVGRYGVLATSGIDGLLFEHVNGSAYLNDSAGLASSDASFKVGEFHINRSGGALLSIKNGVSESDGFPAETAADYNVSYTFKIGKYATSLSLPFEGDIALIVLTKYTGAFNSSEWTDLVNSVKTRYGISY